MDKDLQSVQQVRDFLEKAQQAQKILAQYSQEQVDRLVSLMAERGFNASKELAVLAHEESGLGRVESKVLKNQFATRDIYEYIKEMPTVGIISQCEKKKVWDIATPKGVVAGITPITNPTSTALYKMLISIKARCSIVFSPHPRSIKCVGRAVEIMRKAIDSVGGPVDAVSVITIPTLQATHELMSHKATRVILATGGSGLVKAAYSSGKPAIGVGPGNCPAFIEKSADIPHAIRCLVVSQGFDWATLCSSEQSLIVETKIAQKCIAELKKQKAHVCNEVEIAALENLMPQGSAINADLVGQSPHTIAKLAGFDVDNNCTMLIARQYGVGDQYPLSREKLAPILSLYIEDGWEQGFARCQEILHYGGLGHTVSLHCRDQKIITKFAISQPACRININTPSSQGSVGYASGLAPSMTLGCGTRGGNIFSDNISPKHLLNIKRVAYIKDGWLGQSPAVDMLPVAKTSSKKYDSFSSRQNKYFIGKHNNPNI
ncbi:aldehyde dehydrogenase family protein [Candidatus Uabimicrobium sp. HlEnr_7]|uniref:aldehyde dehydrogenase family protein n=1 Tax=Candidatus Uabimicrobium helgolandensis TaxID=3095367 RepID=UPI003558BFDB